jgi:hypothetical protein
MFLLDVVLEMSALARLPLQGAVLPVPKSIWKFFQRKFVRKMLRKIYFRGMARTRASYIQLT